MCAWSKLPHFAYNYIFKPPSTFNIFLDLKRNDYNNNSVYRDYSVPVIVFPVITVFSLITVFPATIVIAVFPAIAVFSATIVIAVFPAIAVFLVITVFSQCFQ